MSNIFMADQLCDSGPLISFLLSVDRDDDTNFMGSLGEPGALLLLLYLALTALWADFPDPHLTLPSWQMPPAAAHLLSSAGAILQPGANPQLGGSCVCALQEQGKNHLEARLCKPPLHSLWTVSFLFPFPRH